MRQEFWISTIPKGQARPRFARMGKFVKTYDPAQSKDYKADLKWQILEQNPCMMQGPVSLIVDFLMPHPQAHYNKKGLKNNTPHYHTSKPDTDNLIKGLLDAINDTGRIWRDDSQVAVIMATKKYAELPGIKLYIQDMQ